VRKHGWRGHVYTKRALGIRPDRKPNTRGKRQSRVCFRGGQVPCAGVDALDSKVGVFSTVNGIGSVNRENFGSRV